MAAQGNAEESSQGRCDGTPGIPALRRRKQELSSSVAIRVDYVGDPVQNKQNKQASNSLCRCGSRQAEQTS